MGSPFNDMIAGLNAMANDPSHRTLVPPGPDLARLHFYPGMPTKGTAGYALGCINIDDTTGNMWINNGDESTVSGVASQTATACDFIELSTRESA
jgi:hypothetical protein